MPLPSRIGVIVQMILACVAVVVVAEDISFDKVHLVDGIANSFLFRGNAPLTTDASSGNVAFAYDTVMNYTRTRALAANYSTFSSNNSLVYLVDITFENIFDKYFENEAQFWANGANNDKGKYMQWELTGAVEWATGFNATEQDAMIRNGKVWSSDEIPTRIEIVRNMLLEGPPAGYDTLAVYVHCAGGCDRTGEFVGSYRMQYFHTSELKPIYALDVSECGRAPNYFASGALGWYCLTWNLYNASSLSLPPMTDCLTAYTCELFGKCKATGN